MAKPEDFEIGDEPVEVERKPRAGIVISVRFSPEEADELQRMAERQDLTVSQILRRAVTAYARGEAVMNTALPNWTSTAVGGPCDVQVIWYAGADLRSSTRGDVTVDREGEFPLPKIPERLLMGLTGWRPKLNAV